MPVIEQKRPSHGKPKYTGSQERASAALLPELLRCCGTTVPMRVVAEQVAINAKRLSHWSSGRVVLLEDELAEIRAWIAKRTVTTTKGTP